METRPAGSASVTLPALTLTPVWGTTPSPGLALQNGTLTIMVRNSGLNPLDFEFVSTSIDPAGQVFAPVTGLNAALLALGPLAPGGVLSLVLAFGAWNAAQLALKSVTGTVATVFWRQDQSPTSSGYSLNGA